MTRPVTILRACAAIVTGGLLLGLSSPALPADQPEATQAPDSGASLSIAPLRIEMDGGDNGATVYLNNSSTRPLAVQTRLFAWSQASGDDVYAPSSALTISPSISMIPPGETQIVRLLRKAPTSPGEKRFRLAVDQLPDPTLARAGQAEARIRFTLPVFLDRSTATPAQLSWRLSDDRIELANTGGTTVRVMSIAVTAVGGRDVPVERNALRYALGNSTISWPIGKGCSLGPVHVTAQIDGRTVDAQPTPTCS